MRSRGDHHEGSSNDRHDHYGKELLTDAVGSLAMKLLDLEHYLFVSVMILNSPTAKVQLDDVLGWEAALVEHVGQKHRDLPLGADQSDHSELDASGFLPLSGAEPREVVVGRGEGNVVVVPAASHKSLDSGEGGLGRTAEQKVSFVVLSQIGNEIKAGISPIEERNASRREQGQERLRLLPLRSMDTDDSPGYGKTPEDIIGGCHQTLRVMAPSLILESTVGIELLADLLGCRKVVFGAINGNNRHAVPEIGGITRKEAVSKLHGLLQDVSEDGPGDFLASLGKAASVDLLGIRPQSATPGRSEEIPGFDVHSLALSARHNREDEGDELWKGQFPTADKVLGRLSEIRGDLSGDDVKKSCKNAGKLA